MEQNNTPDLIVSDLLFQVVADAIADGIVLTDDQFKIIYWNKGAATIYGYQAEEVLGKDISLLLPQEQHQRERIGRQALKEGAQSKILHTAVINTGMRKDGSLFTAEVSSFIWQHQGRHFFGALIRDVTEKTEREKKIREAKIFLETIFATSPDGILVTDSNGYIIKANQAFLDLTGYTEGEIIGRHPETLYPSDFDPETVPAHIAKVFQDGFLRNYETRRRRKDGTIIDVELSISLLSDADGKFKGMVSCVRDITERKFMEQQREQLVRDLQEALAKVKTLRGLVPICASCKRVRTDQGYWQQIESFIHEHSEAEFSHGICPECMEKLYPELKKTEG